MDLLGRGLVDNVANRMATVNVAGARSGPGEGSVHTCVDWGPLIGRRRLACPVYSHAEGFAEWRLCEV